MTDEEALQYGFDRKGPGTRCGTGFVCECYWASSLHGDKCPEHGAMGTPITKEEIMSEQQTPACTGWYLCKVLDSDDEIEFPGWWDGTKWIMREGSPMTLPHVLRWRGPLIVLEPSQTIREIIEKWSREYRRRGNLPASQAIGSAVLEAVGRMSKQPEPSQTAKERERKIWEDQAENAHYDGELIVSEITAAEQAARRPLLEQIEKLKADLLSASERIAKQSELLSKRAEPQEPSQGARERDEKKNEKEY